MPSHEISKVLDIIHFTNNCIKLLSLLQTIALTRSGCYRWRAASPSRRAAIAALEIANPATRATALLIPAAPVYHHRRSQGCI